MQVKKLTEFAVIPARGTIDAAGFLFRVSSLTNMFLKVFPFCGLLYLKTGFDLSSAVDIVVPKKGKAIVKTDIAIAIPENTYARVGEVMRN